MRYNVSLLANFIEEYEIILMGERSDFSGYFFEDVYTGENLAIECIRYACEKLLKWTPKQTCVLFNRNTVQMMKLNHAIAHIQFPFELEKHQDIEYVLYRLYPRLVSFSMEDAVINMYKQILAGKVQFPRDYATGHEGIVKLCLCLQYAIDHYHPFHSIREMYFFFASLEGIRFLKKYELYSMMGMLGYEPLTLLHEMLPDEQKSQFYFNYLMFWKLYRKSLRVANNTPVKK